MTTVAIGLGSNIGNRDRYLRDAVRRLMDHMVDMRVSTVYETKAWGIVDQPPFLNAVVCGDMRESPEEILRLLKRIEGELGRIERERWGPREIDLDLLLYGDVVVQDGDLQVPHTGLHERATVLLPLRELLPAWRHPTVGKTVEAMAEVVDNAGCVPYPFDWLVRDDDTWLTIECARLCEMRVREDICSALQNGKPFIVRGVFDPSDAAWVIRDIGATLSRPSVELEPYRRTSGAGYEGYLPPGSEAVGKYGVNVRRAAYVIGESAHPFSGKTTRMRVGLRDLARDLYEGIDALCGTTLVVDSQNADFTASAIQYLDQAIDAFTPTYPRHLDFTLLTLALGGVPEGFEVLVDGRWRPVTAGAGDVVVFAGSILARYDIGTPAVYHRAVGGVPGRVTFVGFGEPRRDVVLPNGERFGEVFERIMQKIRAT